MKKTLALLACTVIAIQAKERLPNAPAKGSMIDKRNNVKYEAISIGGQTWMAENLDFPTPGSKCHEDKPENCDKFGRLYTWDMAKHACPQGWHMPTKFEWLQLKAVTGEEKSGATLRAAGWTNGNFWSATEINDISVWALGLDAKESALSMTEIPDRRIGLSVRCVQD